MMLIAALGFAGCVGSADASEDPTGSVEQHNSGSGLFTCVNKASIQVVSCIGSISVLQAINVDIKDVRVLNDNELNVLSGDLNHVSILDGGILNNDKILNDVEVTTLTDFLDKFNVDVTKNDIDVCALVGILNLCK
jgi:hypothetical protein